MCASRRACRCRWGACTRGPRCTKSRSTWRPPSRWVLALLICLDLLFYLWISKPVNPEAAKQVGAGLHDHANVDMIIGFFVQPVRCCCKQAGAGRVNSSTAHPHGVPSSNRACGTCTAHGALAPGSRPWGAHHAIPAPPHVPPPHPTPKHIHHHHHQPLCRPTPSSGGSCGTRGCAC